MQKQNKYCTSFYLNLTNPEKIAGIQEDGFLALHGNASNEHYLKEAGIDRSRGLVAAANSDAQIIAIGTRNQLRELEKLAGI